MSKKWDFKTTNKFIQLYKLHPCLWDLRAPDFKNKYKREVAYISIVQDMNIPEFGIQEVKNKIKNLRSTYNQEIKKIQDSLKAGAGLSNVYTPSIKWLPQMDEVFMHLKKKPDENESVANDEDTYDQDSCTQEIHITRQSRRPKKRNVDAIKASSYMTPSTAEANASVTETAFDMFGKSVAMQLKALSVENGLLAQCKIQNILTEFGITDHRQKTASRSSMSNHSNQRTSPEFLEDTDASSNNDVPINPIHVTSPITVHQVKRRRRLDI